MVGMFTRVDIPSDLVGARLHRETIRRPNDTGRILDRMHNDPMRNIPLDTIPPLLPGEIFANRYVLIHRIAQTKLSSVWLAFDPSRKQPGRVARASFEEFGYRQQQVWQALLKAGYIDKKGVLQRKFNGIEIKLNGFNTEDTKRIMDILLRSQTVALKISSGEEAKFLANEAERLAALSNPAFPRMFAYGGIEDVEWIAMEFIEGNCLYDIFKRKERITLERAIEIALQITQVLKPVHAKDMIHRDLKPANIMLDENGKVRLIDFGIACNFLHQDQPDEIHGSPHHIAPEQLDRKFLDFRVDIYALALLLHESAEGGNPMVEKYDLIQTFQNHLSKSMPHLSFIRFAERFEAYAERFTPVEGRGPITYLRNLYRKMRLGRLRGQIAELHRQYDELVIRMSEKDRNNRLSDLDRIGSELRKARKLARKLSRYEYF